MRKTTPMQRFNESVTRDGDGGCWLWRGGLERKGYGFFHLGRKISTHRASWILHNGPIPDGMWVLHKCDVRACVNPAHLYLGTVAENARDMVSRARTAVGTRNGSAKLTPEAVLAIRASNKKTGTLARMYGVDWNVIDKILTRTNWKHI